jgi:ParB-like chromosome segregation protein Spo0J
MKTNTRTTFGTHTQHAPAVLPLAGLVHWAVNPRHDLTAGGEEMRESLTAVGQMDDVHVWRCLEGDKILRGNRRVANMRKLGWRECRQVVHEFSDERDAFLYLLEDRGFGHSMDLSADEKIVAVMSGVKLGMNVQDLHAALGVTEERAQLWFDLGECLPPAARDALHAGSLSMATAEVLIKVEDAKLRREAAQLILKGVDGEPMAPGQARNVIEAQFILPEKWRKGWAVLMPKLKKKLLVSDGFHFVNWEDREEFVMGTSGQPLPGFEFARALRPKTVQTWGEAAEARQVPRYVCPAPQHVDGHVVLVSVKMVRDAESAEPAGGGEGEEETIRQGDKETGGQGDGETVGPWEMEHSDEPLKVSKSHGLLVSESDREWLRMALGKIEEALYETPTDAMGKGPWEPLMEYLCFATAGGAALEAWKGITTLEECEAMVAGDKKPRWYLRRAILLLLCAQCDAASDVEAGAVTIRAVAEALGIATSAK